MIFSLWESPNFLQSQWPIKKCQFVTQCYVISQLPDPVIPNPILPFVWDGKEHCVETFRISASFLERNESTCWKTHSCVRGACLPWLFSNFHQSRTQECFQAERPGKAFKAWSLYVSPALWVSFLMFSRISGGLALSGLNLQMNGCHLPGYHPSGLFAACIFRVSCECVGSLKRS